MFTHTPHRTQPHIGFNPQVHRYHERPTYTLHVPCPHDHLKYIIGRGGATLTHLVTKWNGKINNVIVNTPSTQYGRPDHHFTIIGDEKAVHLLALEMNDMIKVSMARLVTKYKCDLNNIDLEQQKTQTNILKIAELEAELEMLKNEKKDIARLSHIHDLLLFPRPGAKSDFESDTEDIESDEEEIESDDHNNMEFAHHTWKLTREEGAEW